MATLICCTRPVDDRAHWWILLSVSSRCIDQWNESSMDNLNHPWVFAKLRVILRDEITKGGDEIIEGGNWTKSGNIPILQFKIILAKRQRRGTTGNFWIRRYKDVKIE